VADEDFSKLCSRSAIEVIFASRKTEVIEQRGQEQTRKLAQCESAPQPG
jgi:hypothetical protein